MRNAEIARVFSEIGALLEIKGEDRFKVRAYERVAETVANLGQDVSDLREAGELQSIPGVGKSTAAKIEELLDTGKCTHHQELLSQIPPTVFEMLRVPGVGPKTVKVLIDREGIATVEELESAARAGRLRDLPGMGEKTEQEILRGIAHLREYSKRTNLGVAWAAAEGIMGQLRGDAPVDQMEAAGSLRRMKETIGDIDILITSEQPEAVMDRFVGLDLVAEVVARGPTKSSILTDAGVQADLRVVPPESFGAALQYFTGSKQHNVKLRDLAVRSKIKLNEYGVFRVKGGKDVRMGGRVEEEMYAALGLPMMPPELREDQGEIEVAREGRLPDLIELSDIRGDLQMHSNWSDGKDDIEGLARAAKALGYRYIAITDHSPSQTVAGGLVVEQLHRRRKDIAAARKAVPGIAVLDATEVDIKRDGRLDYPDEVLAELDFVVASVHSGWKMEREAMTARIIKAMENPWVDCIGHPTGRLIGQREPYELDMEAVLAAAARLGVAMEINAYPDRLDLKDAHARRAKELGVKLLINTDAHGADQLALMRFGVATARRGWIEAGEVLNTLPLSHLRRRLRRARSQQRRRRKRSTS
ncbi:MAG: DNA polymerase/3'-5' exonuclease PolX [Armatimonadota bacterium]|nr:MAG: DNA polymerase/3'-5' exonuclease PolX [Armatimonadota bacterium]